MLRGRVAALSAGGDAGTTRWCQGSNWSTKTPTDTIEQIESYWKNKLGVPQVRTEPELSTSAKWRLVRDPGRDAWSTRASRAFAIRHAHIGSEPGRQAGRRRTWEGFGRTSQEALRPRGLMTDAAGRLPLSATTSSVQWLR